jgi:hypothetical protein
MVLFPHGLALGDAFQRFKSNEYARKYHQQAIGLVRECIFFRTALSSHLYNSDYTALREWTKYVCSYTPLFSFVFHIWGCSVATRVDTALRAITIQQPNTEYMLSKAQEALTSFSQAHPTKLIIH